MAHEGTTNAFGYMVDLSGVQFDEAADGTKTSWIQAMPLGKYDHPFFGPIEFTPERLQRFADSVANQVRDTELDIDYDHKMNTGEAAGWVKKAEVRANDGLYIFVEWTKTAAEKIKEKAYKYFSPEFADEWRHPKTGATYKDVLFGGGITNRPFLKDILPLNLSELIRESGGTIVVNQITQQSQPAHQGGGNKMATKKFSELSLNEVQSLAKTLGLSEDAPFSSVEKALNDLVGKTDDTSGGGTGTAGGGAPQGGQPSTLSTESLEKRLAEGHLDDKLLADISALVADNPANKVLAEVIEAQQIELAQTGQALRFSEAQGRITKLQEMAIQKRLAFPGKVQEDLRDILIDMPKKYSDKVYKVFETLANTGMVPLGELGKSYRPNGATAHATLNDRALALQQQNPGMSYGDAVERVAADNPRTFDDYRSDVMELD
jgi:hypothetical protein